VKFLDHVDDTLKKEPGVSIHIVLDNYATHKTPAVKRWLLRHLEYHLHFIPTSSSWLNQIERFFAEITENVFVAAPSAVFPLWSKPSTSSSTNTTSTRSRSHGSPTPIRSSNASKRFVNGLPVQDTRPI